MSGIKKNYSVLAVYCVAISLQLTLIWRAFGVLFYDPDKYMLQNGWDGLKNYFTFLSYLNRPFSEGIWLYKGMNYPFGDYVFYTDNTPLLAIFIKLFSHYVTDVTLYNLQLYHLFFISGFIASTILLIKILFQLINSKVLIVVCSVAWPWINPQTSRLLIGHANLSSSFVLLFVLWGLIEIYKRVQNNKSIWGWVSAVIVILMLSAFVHLYYLIIVALATGSFFIFWLFNRRKWQWNIVVAGGLITLLPLLLSLLIIRSVDSYYALRSIDGTSFDFLPWRLQVSALFQSYPYQKIKFIIEAKDEVSYESRAYLGAATLFSIVGATIAIIVWPDTGRSWWRQWRSTWQFKFLLLFLYASLVGLFAAMGTNYMLFNDTYIYKNYLSVLFYIQKITNAAAHFRAVGRLSWPFFWAINLLVIFGFDYWWHMSRSWGRWVVLAGVIILFSVDTKDAVKYYQTSLNPNIFSAEKKASIIKLTNNINPNDYQAILPIPYFHVGSEDMELIVDDDNDFSAQTFQLSLQTGLPLLATKMSRTAPAQARALLTLFDPNGPEPILRAHLTKKPVLVFIDQTYYNGSRDILSQQTRDTPRRIIGAGATFAEDHKLTLLAEVGLLRLYRWDVPATPNGM